MIKKKFTKLIAIITIFSLLTACSSGQSDDTETSDTSTSTDTVSTDTVSTDTETTDTTSDEDTSDEDITISLMFSGTTSDNDFETTVLPEMVHEAFPNITLEATKLPDDQYYTALKTKLASGEAPDIILVQPKYAGSNSVISLAEAGYLEPLDDMDVLSTIGEGGTDPFSYDGSVYGLPSGVTILGTYYNKDIFDQYGLDVPQDWDDFLDVCATLKENGVQPIVMGDKDMYVMQFGLYQLAANKIYPQNPSYDDDLRTGDVSFTDEGTWDTVLSMYKTLYDEGYIASTSLGLGSDQAIQKFIDGEAAMIFDGSFDAPSIEAAGSVDFERGYFPLPGNDEGDQVYAAMAMGAGPAITATSDYVDECKEILNLWFDGESDIYKAYVDSGKIIPSYGYGSDDVDPLFSDFFDLYNEGYSYYWCNQGWPSGVETEMEELFSEMVGGMGTDVDDITQGMQDKFDELMEE